MITCDNFNFTLDVLLATNPFLIVTIGDFNAKSDNRHTAATANFENSKIETVTCQFGLEKTINEPTPIQGKSAYRSYLHLSIKFGYGVRYPPIASPKLPSSDTAY